LHWAWEELTALPLSEQHNHEHQFGHKTGMTISEPSRGARSAPPKKHGSHQQSLDVAALTASFIALRQAYGEVTEWPKVPAC